MNNSDFDSYLTKVGLTSKPALTEEGLKALHNAQHRRIPFENFDIALGKNISLSDEDLINKLIYKERGGYCFELNGLLLKTLKATGFDTRALLGRVHLAGEPTGRSHQVSVVNLDEQLWIVDAGFGSHTPRSPLPLVTDKELSTDIQTFRFIETEQFGYMLQVKLPDDNEGFIWQSLYSLDMTNVYDADKSYGNFYVSNHPKSLFVTSRIAAFPIENGIVTIFNNTMKKVVNGITEETVLEENESYLETLRTQFGIKLEASFSDLKPLATD